MKQLIIALFAIALLAGCVHKINIEQGNIITPDRVKRLHIGMSMAQVKDIMGNPVLINTFNDNRIDYIYTFKPAYGDTTQQSVILFFRKNTLKEIKASI